jgi:hypothetical protein
LFFYDKEEMERRRDNFNNEKKIREEAEKTGG